MFSYSGNDLYCEQVPLADLAARVGTPAYVYSSQALLDNFRAYDDAFGDAAALGLLRGESQFVAGGAGAAGQSGRRLRHRLRRRAIPRAAGRRRSAPKVVFSGVGKTAAEMEYALASGIHSFNCESEAELALIDAWRRAAA